MGEPKANVQSGTSGQMRQVFDIFFKAEGTRPFIVLICLFIGSTLEAVGVGSLLPALGTIMNSASTTPSPFEARLRDLLSMVNLKPDFETLLLLAVVLLTVQAIVINRLAGIDYPLWAKRTLPGKG